MFVCRKDENKQKEAGEGPLKTLLISQTLISRGPSNYRSTRTFSPLACLIKKKNRFMLKRCVQPQMSLLLLLLLLWCCCGVVVVLLWW